MAEILIHPVYEARAIVVNIQRQSRWHAQNQGAAKFGFGIGLLGPVDFFRMGGGRRTISHDGAPLRSKLKAGKAVALKGRVRDGGEVAVQGFHVRGQSSYENHGGTRAEITGLV
jgi:hypothetical protein